MSAYPISRSPRTRGVMIVMIISALVITALAVPPASAASAVQVINPVSGRCLDVAGNNHQARAKIKIYDCNGQENQAWTFTAAGELRIFNGSMCLDVPGQDRTSPARVQTYACNGGANQKWRLQSNGTITGVQSGLCLDVSGAKKTNSTVVGLWTCTGKSNQQWTTAGTGPDGQPPSVPGNPRVSALTCNSVNFAWNAATDNVRVAFYDVYHDGQLMTSVSGTTLSTRLTVVPGVAWGLFVNARDAAGNVSQASSTVRISPPQCQADSTPPSAPTRLVGSTSGTTVTLSWAASSDNVGVRSYEIFRDGSLVGTVVGTGAVPPATTTIDSGLAVSRGYVYYVVARDAQGNTSGHSNNLTVRTGAACTNSICTVRQVATDKDIPWGLVTLKDGSILYSRRDAHDIIHLNPVTGAKITVGKVPNVQNTDGEGGLLGLAVSPSFATDHWLYIMHTSPSDNRIVRIKLENDRLGSEQVLVTGILRNKHHDGGRLRFGPDGKLYASTGDALNRDTPQNRNSLNGKVLRINPDGTVPSDNPFGNRVWSYGHRNPQGLAFDSQGRLWEQEFGNSVMDETNLITRGGNYGWPGCEGTSGTCSTTGLIAPKRTYPVAQGSCSGIAVVANVLYVACERGTRLYRAEITGSSLTNVQPYLTGTYGRLRTVEPALDGGLWLATTNGGDKDSTANNSDNKILHVTLGS